MAPDEKSFKDFNRLQCISALKLMTDKRVLLLITRKFIAQARKLTV